MCHLPAARRRLALQPIPQFGWHALGVAGFLKPAEVAALARSAGLEIDAITGMTYNPFTRVYRLAPDTAVNYIATFRRHD